MNPWISRGVCLGFLALLMGLVRAQSLANRGFEAGASAWSGRGCIITPVSSPVHVGAGAVRVSDRSQSWHSLRQEVTGQVQAGVTYEVSAWVRMASGSHEVRLSLRTEISGGGAVNPLDSPLPVSDDQGWTQIRRTTPPLDFDPGDKVFLEIANKTTEAEFFVDEVQLIAVGVADGPRFVPGGSRVPSAAVGVGYLGSVADDLEGEDGMFSKVVGPGWLSVSADGLLSGVPMMGDVGKHEVTVRVEDGAGRVVDASFMLRVIEPTSLPYREGFEFANEWSPLEGLAGWVETLGGFGTVRPQSISMQGGFPISGLPHARVAEVEDEVEMLVAARLGHPEVVADFLIQPVFRSDPEPPKVDAASKAAMFFDAAGQLNVHHAVHVGDFTDAERRWSALTHAPVTPGDWVRVRIICDESGDTLRGHRYFRVELDGVLLSGSESYATPSPVDEAADFGGPHFLCANHSLGDLQGLRGVAFSGRQRIDDLSITAPASRTSRGTPYEWIESYLPGAGFAAVDMEDPDGDGEPTWREYLAGTNPDDRESVLRLKLGLDGDGGAGLEWSGGLGGALTPYVIERSTRLADDWLPLGLPVERDQAPSILWSDPSPPPGGSGFYRIRFIQEP